VSDIDAKAAAVANFLNEYRERAEAVEAERDALLNLVRNAEWSGSAGRCPWCQEWPAVPAKDFPGGHAADCQALPYFPGHPSR
jgi:hypothetical protein